MKNRRKQGKIFRSLLAVLMLTAMLVTSVLQPVFAGDYEAGKTGNLTLTVQQADEEGNQTPLPDVGLTIYKVGSVNFDGNVHFVLDEALAAAAIDFDSITTADGWYEAAEKLAAMIVSGSVDVWGMSKSSDAEGNMTFADLAEGMYLVVQTDGNSSVMVSPMLISVPFADQEQGWMYDVQAYPKSVSNPPKHTQIQVTKRIYNVDDNGNVIPLETKEDVTYKVGVFSDQEGTIPFRDDYLQDIHIQNASSGTATWTDVPDGTYYVFELDEDGNLLQQNTEIKVDDQNFYYYDVTKPNGENEEKSNQVVIGGDSGVTEAAAYVNNYYTKIPDIFSRNGFINIKKNVMIDGVSSTVDDTFYAGVFSTESNGELTLEKVVTLKQNDSVQVMLDLPKDQEINSVTYTVLETDKDGNLIYLYANNKDEQYSYIEAATNKGYNVLLMDGQLDIAVVSMLEQKFEKVRFTRVDSDIIDNLIVKEDKKNEALEAGKQEVLSSIFKSQLPKMDKTEFNITAQALGENATPIMITQSEYMRRMKEMANIQAGMSFYGEMPDMFNLVLNSDHKLVKEVLADEDKECAAAVAPVQAEMDEVNKQRTDLKKKQEGKKDEDIPTAEKDKVNELDKKWDELKTQKEGIFADYAAKNKVVRQLIDLALLQNGMLKGEALNNFVKRSIDLIK